MDDEEATLLGGEEEERKEAHDDGVRAAGEGAKGKKKKEKKLGPRICGFNSRTHQHKAARTLIYEDTVDNHNLACTSCERIFCKECKPSHACPHSSREESTKTNAEIFELQRQENFKKRGRPVKIEDANEGQEGPRKKLRGQRAAKNDGMANDGAEANEVATDCAAADHGTTKGLATPLSFAEWSEVNGE